MHLRKKNPSLRPRTFKKYDLVITLGENGEKTKGFYRTESNYFAVRADRYTLISEKGVKMLLYSFINSVFMFSNIDQALNRKYRVLIYHQRKHTSIVNTTLGFLREEFGDNCEVKRRSYWK